MEREVENFLASHAYSAATKELYAYVLMLLIQHDFKEWGASQLLAFVERESWGSSMQYVALCACKKFIGWLYGQAHPALLAKKKRIKPKKGRSLNSDQIVLLLASFDTYTAKGARDLALASLAIDTGLRASELARLKLADVDIEHHTLQVIVKGGQWGMGIYSADTAAFIERWLAYRCPADGVGALFVSLRLDTTRGRALTSHGIKSIFKRWGLELGMRFSPHDARRTFGNQSTMNGAPMHIVMAAGRWSSEDAFRRYVQDVTARSIEPYLPVSNALKHKS